MLKTFVRVTITSDTQIADAKSRRKLSATSKTSISKDGKWKSFLTHANLMQYISNGIFFAQAKVNDFVKRARIETDVLTTAKSRLRGNLNELRQLPGDNTP